MPDTKTRRTTEWLPCHLSDIEILDRADKLSRVVQDMATEVDRQTDQRSQMKARMAALEAEQTALASAIARREEHKDVEVAVTIDYEQRVEVRVRMDTGEEVGRRRLNDDELQQSLPGTDDAAKWPGLVDA